MSSPTDYRELWAPLKKLAKASKAKLGGVACFVVRNGAIVSSGINHSPTGEPMEYEVDGKLVSKPEVVHAEVAALQAAAKNGIDVRGTTLLLNMSPCIACAGVIVKAGVSEVFYRYEWWDKASLDILRGAGIHVEQIKEDA